MFNFLFISDDSHGWLQVDKYELKRYGIEEKISSCSYMCGDTVYLEEDCDAGLFLNELKKANINFSVEEKYLSGQCFIRELESYQHRGNL